MSILGFISNEYTWIQLIQWGPDVTKKSYKERGGGIKVRVKPPGCRDDVTNCVIKKAWMFQSILLLIVEIQKRESKCRHGSELGR